MAAKDTLGKRGEQLAAQYLVAHGYRVIDRNWRCALGEIDLVVAATGETVIVEVKTRSSVAFGHPFEAVTAEKLARLRRLAIEWCVQSGVHSPIRIDVVAVIAPAGAEPQIEHLQGVF